MICSTCKKNKNELHPKPSKIAPGMTLFQCDECIASKREPRYLIIIYGRRNGFDSVSDYIKHRRYVGEEILASEMLK